MSERIEHTPGEWTAEAYSREILIVGRGPVIAGCIATVSLNWLHADQRKEQEANARLIAASPALLQALETLIAVVGLTAFKHEGQRKVLQEAVDGANAALKLVQEKGKQ